MLFLKQATASPCPEKSCLFAPKNYSLPRSRGKVIGKYAAALFVMQRFELLAEVDGQLSWPFFAVASSVNEHVAQ